MQYQCTDIRRIIERKIHTDAWKSIGENPDHCRKSARTSPNALKTRTNPAKPGRMAADARIASVI